MTLTASVSRALEDNQNLLLFFVVALSLIIIPSTTENNCSRHPNLATCYQLAQSFWR